MGGNICGCDNNEPEQDGEENVLYYSKYKLIITILLF
jgi:hypothetical protein